MTPASHTGSEGSIPSEATSRWAGARSGLISPATWFESRVSNSLHELQASSCLPVLLAPVANHLVVQRVALDRNAPRLLDDAAQLGDGHLLWRIATGVVVDL